MRKFSYAGYRFPPEIIRQAIWLYLRFTLSLRDVEDLLAERGIIVSYETVRRWVNHFGPTIAADLRSRRPKPHTTWHLDARDLGIEGRHERGRWRNNRAENSHQPTRRRERTAAPYDLRSSVIIRSGTMAYFLRSLRISFNAACLFKMQRFKSSGSAQKFLSSHAAIFNTFNVQRHLTSAQTHRTLRAAAMKTWREAAVPM
jgi:putative transposase